MVFGKGTKIRSKNNPLTYREKVAKRVSGNGSERAWRNNPTSDASLGQKMNRIATRKRAESVLNEGCGITVMRVFCQKRNKVRNQKIRKGY